MSNMEREFIPYQEALALKELGFDEPCLGLWNLNNGKYEVDIIGVCKYSKEFKYREVLAPLYQQAFRWFREKYKIRFFIQSGMSDLGEFFKVIFPDGEQRNMSYITYEEAELACLRMLIEIVKGGSK